MNNKLQKGRPKFTKDEWVYRFELVNSIERLALSKKIPLTISSELHGVLYSTYWVWKKRQKIYNENE